MAARKPGWTCPNCSRVNPLPAPTCLGCLTFRGMEHLMSVEGKAQTEILASFSIMTPRDRETIFDMLRLNFCMHCGNDDPRCQCWNDE